MKSFYLSVFIFFSFLFISNTTFAGRCSGGANCTACSNCSSCKNCSENGGSCSVCANYDEPEPQIEEVSIPAEEPSPSNYESNLSNESSSNSEFNDIEEVEKETSYSWLWWILGGLVFIGVIFSSKK